MPGLGLSGQQAANAVPQLQQPLRQARILKELLCCLLALPSGVAMPKADGTAQPLEHALYIFVQLTICGAKPACIQEPLLDHGASCKIFQYQATAAIC